MHFARFGISGMLAAALLASVSTAHAQEMNVNCAALSGSPFICLKNKSPKALLAIQTVAPNSGWANPQSWVPIQGGGVPAGGVAVVKMPTYKGCMQNVVIRSDDGQPHYFWNTDLCHLTSMLIRW